jgi:hypothetical protein
VPCGYAGKRSGPGAADWLTRQAKEMLRDYGDVQHSAPTRQAMRLAPGSCGSIWPASSMCTFPARDRAARCPCARVACRRPPPLPAAYEELVHGVNWFRRLLGLAYVILLVVRVAGALHP